MRFIKHIIPFVLFLLLISIQQGCTSSSYGLSRDSLFLETTDLRNKYDLNTPIDKHFMPYVLEEISGLTFVLPNSLLTIDDESGKTYQYDLDLRKITNTTEFSEPGDYEGVELVNDRVFVLKSNGDLLEFPFSSAERAKTTAHKNPLSSENDTEGLGYDPGSSKLLIACKEKPDIGKKKLKGRAFYFVDLTTKTLSAEPAFTLGTSDLLTFWKKRKRYDYEPSKIRFKPSAIAVHPVSGHYYILSSVGKMLIVVNKRGEIQGTYPISPRVLRQPEGICFSPGGDMFISSEGDGDKGYILHFKIENQAL